MTLLISSPEELFFIVAAIFSLILALVLCRYLLVFILATGEWLTGGEFKSTLVYCLNNS
jgi:hypothetical protein